MDSSRKCGPHTELVTQPTLRVTRCGCGTVHLTLTGPGVTLRLSPEQARTLASGMRAAVERIDAAEVGSSCVN
jgi:hypothetical protein